MFTWKLEREHWPFQDLTFSQNDKKKIIGRTQSDIDCDSPYVSRRHCSIFLRHGILYIKDLQSTNGTFLNRVKLPPKMERELRHDDLIGLGVADMTETDTPSSEYFVFRFRLFEPEEVNVDPIIVKVESIPLITLDDDDEALESCGVMVGVEKSDNEIKHVPSKPGVSKYENGDIGVPSVEDCMPPPPPLPILGVSEIPRWQTEDNVVTKRERSLINDTAQDEDCFRRLRRLARRLHEDTKSEKTEESISGGTSFSSPKGQKRRVPESDPNYTKPDAEPNTKRIRVSVSPPVQNASPDTDSKCLNTSGSAIFKKPTIPRSPIPGSSTDNVTLEAAKARVRNTSTTTTPRNVIQLDHAPGHGRSPTHRSRNSAASESESSLGTHSKKTSVVNPFYIGGGGSRELFDKLKEAELKSLQSPVSPAYKVKDTSHNRTEIFAKSLQNNTHARLKPVVKRRMENADGKLAAVNPAEVAQMPVMQIIQDMSKVKVTAGKSKPARKPERPKLNAEFYRNRMQKTGYCISPVKPVESVPIPIRAGTSGSGPVADDCKELAPQDEVYRNVLEWNTHWLEEQYAQKTKISPPVYGSRRLVTNLPGFKDYESYISTFYPLMILELWASVYQDYYRPNKNRLGDRSGGRCNFQVQVEKVDVKDHCPMLPPLDKTERRNLINTKPKPFWHCIKLMTLTATKDLNKTNDFGILEVDFMRVNGVDAGVKAKRSVFGFFLSESELYEEINPATSDQYKLFPQNPQYKYKFSVTFVTHMNEHQDIVRINLGTIQRFSYISSKIRDFRAISLLQSSKLFDRIIHPSPPEASEVYQPNNSVNVAGLVKDVMDLLNPIQRGVVQHISSRILTREDSELLLIHGPPGTGKTRTIVGLVLQLLKASQSKNVTKQKLLICTPSNTAIDELIRRLSAALGETFRIVRIGQGCPEVKQFQLDELSKKHCSGASQLESIKEAVTSTTLKITQLQDKLAEMNSKSPNDTIAGAIKSEIQGLRNKRQLYAEDLGKTRNNKKALDRAKIDVLHGADVVCSTLSSCCNSFVRKHLVPRKNNKNSPSMFTCCIIDEATQATEPESLSPLMLNCEKLILVGDPMQLPATVLSTEAENRDFGQSLFTRLYNFYQTSPVNPVMMLTQQYRMSEAILQWPNLRFYQNKLTTSTTVKCDPKRALRLQPYLFLNIDSQENNNNRQFSNMVEVRLIKEILLTVKRQSSLHPNHANLTIGIITPYSEQRTKLLKLLDEFKEIDRNDSSTFSASIEVDTVDSFQGREKDIVLLSCVRTEELGFLKTPQRLNVSLTRARMCLFVVGNAACLNANEMWRSLMDDAARRQLYKTIPNDDPSHPERYSQAVEKCLLLSTK